MATSAASCSPPAQEEEARGQCLMYYSRPLRYSPKNPALQSETVHYKRGVSQQFSLPSFKIDFSEWKDDEVVHVAGPSPPFSLSAGMAPVWGPWQVLVLGDTSGHMVG